MIPFDIIFDPEIWKNDLTKAEHVYSAEVFGVSIINEGTAQGRPSVFVRIDLGTGEHKHIVMAQTTARLFCGAAKAIMAKYPDLFEDDKHDSQN